MTDNFDLSGIQTAMAARIGKIFTLRHALSQLAREMREIHANSKHWNCRMIVCRSYKPLYNIALRHSNARLLLNGQILLVMFEPRAALLLEKLPNRWAFFSAIGEAIDREQVLGDKISYDAVAQAVKALAKEISASFPAAANCRDVNAWRVEEIEQGKKCGALIEDYTVGSGSNRLILNPMLTEDYVIVGPVDNDLEQKYAQLAAWCANPHPLDGPITLNDWYKEIDEIQL